VSAQCESTGRRAGGADMPFFERYLSLWVALCIVVGILLGRFLPGVFDTLGAVEVARVNLPVAVLIWLMILPMDQLDSYIAGLIILAAAPCTAMVVVWSNLSDGHPGFTLSQVALNDLILA
jgi:ACR3 family arsenite transporter